MNADTPTTRWCPVCLTVPQPDHDLDCTCNDVSWLKRQARWTDAVVIPRHAPLTAVADALRELGLDVTAMHAPVVVEYGGAGSDEFNTDVLVVADDGGAARDAA